MTPYDLILPAAGLFVAAVALGVFCTWAARGLAVNVGLVDKPDGRRKIHARPIAVAGGLGVFAAATIALLIGAIVVPEIGAEMGRSPRRTLGLFAAALVIAAVGLVDDVIALRARHKLLGQVIAAGVLIFGGGIGITKLGLFGAVFELGWLGPVVTLFWLLAAINALNLLDGMDGLLGTVSGVMFLALGVMAFSIHENFPAWVAVAAAGAVVGFLRFNLPPATVFLGDCGSMLIGLTVGALSVESSLKGPTAAILTPAALLVLPIFDTAAAIVRRKLTGRGIAVPDRGHLHHVLRRAGLTDRRVLALVAGLGTLGAVGALVSVYMQHDAFALLAVGAVVVILLAGGLFGNAEMRLIRGQAAAAVRAVSGMNADREVAITLQGSTDWRAAWRQIVRLADALGLSGVALDVNAPAWHEGFHAKWDRRGAGPTDRTTCKLVVPLVGHGQVIAHLTAVAGRDDRPMAELMAALGQLAAVAETEVSLAAATNPTVVALTPPPVPALPAAV